MKSDKMLLEEFFLKNKEFEILESKLNEFNIFKVLGVIETEIRHSNFLAWLLDPNENHGVGSYFLKKFLSSFLYHNDIKDISLIELERMNFNQVEVRREWRNIDILLLIHGNKENYLIAIENKIWSSENNGQLDTYYKTLTESFDEKEYKRFLIYLIPDTNPYKNKTNKFWLDFNYSNIIEAINQTINFHKDILNTQILNFINNYVTSIKRYILMNDAEIKQLCKIIWESHNEALEILIKNKPNIVFDYADKLYDKLKNLPQIEFRKASKLDFKTSTIKQVEEKNNNSFSLSYYILKDVSDLSINLYLTNKGDSDVMNSVFDFLKQENLVIESQKKFLEKESESIMIYTKPIINFKKEITSVESHYNEELEKEFNNFFADLNKIDNRIQNYKYNAGA